MELEPRRWRTYRFDQDDLVVFGSMTERQYEEWLQNGLVQATDQRNVAGRGSRIVRRHTDKFETVWVAEETAQERRKG